MQTYSLYYRGILLTMVQMPAGFQSDDKVRCKAMADYDAAPGVFNFSRNSLIFSTVKKDTLIS